MKNFALVITAAAAFLALGCALEEPAGPTAPTLVNDTPANCLKVLAASWSAKDYGRFKACLAPDFVFDFNPSDVGRKVEGYAIPHYWTYEEMLGMTQNMYVLAASLECGIPVTAVGTPGGNDDTWNAINIPISLTILQGPEDGCRVGAGYCYYAFERYDEGGARRWRLTEWWDFTRAGTAPPQGNIEPTSLGLALALYR